MGRFVAAEGNAASNDLRFIERDCTVIPSVPSSAWTLLHPATLTAKYVTADAVSVTTVVAPSATSIPPISVRSDTGVRIVRFRREEGA